METVVVSGSGGGTNSLTSGLPWWAIEDSTSFLTPLDSGSLGTPETAYIPDKDEKQIEEDQSLVEVLIKGLVAPVVTPVAGSVLSGLLVPILEFFAPIIPIVAPMPTADEPNVDDEVMIEAFRPPPSKPPSQDVTPAPFLPPNWGDIARGPFDELPWSVPQFPMPGNPFGGEVGNPWKPADSPVRRTPATRVDPRIPTALPGDFDDTVIVRPGRPTSSPANRPAPVFSPYALPAPGAYPFGDPDLFPLDAEPVGTPTARPTARPEPFANPFATPLRQPWATPLEVPLETPWGEPTLSPETPTRTPSTTPTAPPTRSPLPTSFDLPSTFANPMAEPQPGPKASDPCNCVAQKPKKPKPRKPRTVCWKGSYTETSRSLFKNRREKIPCR